MWNLGKPGAAMALAVPALLAAWSPASAQTQREAVLERRVEQLESRLAKQDDVIRELKALVNERLAATQPPATVTKVTRSGKEGVELTVSGQVNRAVLVANDGVSTNVFHVDNDNSSTRLNIKGRGQFDEDFGVGAQLEVEFESNSLAAVNQLRDEGVGPNNFKERKLEVWLESKRFGKLSLGQGDTASNGTSEVDKSGTKVVAYSKVEDMAGGLLFANTSPAPGSAAVTLANPTIGATFDNFDGLSRDDRIRYDTPKVFGAQLSASHTADDDSDVALRYGGKFGSVEAEAAFAFAYRPDNRNQYAGSASAIHDSGINVTAAAGVQSFQAAGAAADPMFWYVKLGYLFNPFSFGATALSVDYEHNEDILLAGDSGHSYGFFAVQNIDKVATELYLGVRNYDYDQSGANFDDILAVMAGARVKF